MHDLRAIRENPQAFDAGLARRGVEPIAARILELDERRRSVTTRVQESQARRNEASKAIGAAMGKGDTATAEALKAEVAQLKDTLPALEDEDRALGAELDELLAAIPNIPAEDIPDGEDETGNLEVARWGEQRNFAFEPQEHADLGPPLGLDFETGAAMSGARFTFLRGSMARLHRALAQFMLDFHTAQRGYVECAPPLLVRDETVFGTGQLPKFADDLFRTTDGRWLIPTAEVSLTNSVREQILDDLSQPIRLTALTPCFRSEAGAAGKDTRGFIRQHQFEKVELVTICRPEDWQAEHGHMVESAEAILETLGLPYRKMLLCAGDMGAGAKKTFDLEVWLPGQDAYREISSISWCGDYQARRMNARYRPEGQKGTAFVHTLNGSGLAVGRTLVAVLENYQQEDGTVAVPAALTAYMGGVDKLVPAT
ncbi:serine--tRNA ligase [Croceibacterium sp. LX-88]|uniref:Serine--tRNA ligase n=1 Tax=Croceibacterium selenioxidans TaxID=2838833 RepID=A0ABS5W014_9SPHN|nr:serine--tRNA ligase [Croceibacterium selenioxidans]MBT2132979.1 serine--tRNA ligase [Croceibacterium selenioxidans]